MDDQRWEALVRRLDQRARKDPAAYRRKVARVAALGYGYIALALLVVAALAAVVIYLGIRHPGPLLKLLLPILAVGWLVVRSLAVRIDPPEGIELHRHDAPALFESVDDLNRQVRGPRVDHVLVDGELNAGVVQIPRLGVFGARNYLVIGLPLLDALSPDEFRGVLAHELAHLSHSHGRFGTWLYRVRATWWQLLAALEEKKSWGTLLFRRFFEWYVPYFNAHAFPLMRTHEFEADRLAADAVGGEILARALAQLSVSGRFLDTAYWPNVGERATREPQPPESIYGPLAAELVQARMLPGARKWVADEIDRPAGVADTHPSFAERLEALDVPLDSVLAGGTDGDSAANRFLGDTATRIRERLDADWRGAVLEDWLVSYRDAQEERTTLDELERRAAGEQLDLEDLRLLASLTDSYRDEALARERYQALLAAAPDDAVAQFSIGRILLEHGDDEGLRRLEAAMDADPDAIVPACGLAFDYLNGRGREQEAERYRARAQQHAESLAGEMDRTS